MWSIPQLAPMAQISLVRSTNITLAKREYHCDEVAISLIYEHQHNVKTCVVKLQFAMQILFLSLAVGMSRDAFARNYERGHSA